jgi:lipopolysaccharide/colanic/teichoic acid biosynthesis glycosyltransferase
LRILKRFFDITVALAMLIALAPIMVVMAILIKLDSRGPVFYCDLRVGRNGRLFTMYKFRTMAERAGTRQITRIGRMLRAASLDELPQLLNVLAGDMSLIGPRPRLPHEISLADTDWQRTLALRPGITGVAQLTYGINRVDDQIMRAIDLEYLKRRSLKMDAKLLLRTFVMLTRQVKRSG